MLAALDLNAPEAKPIVKMLEDIPSALRFILENNLDHLRDVGQNTEAPCAKVCALIFGKDESGDFAFNQAMVDGVAADLFFWFSGRVVGSQTVNEQAAAIKPELPPFYLSPLLHLCVSDANKMLLVESSSAIALITEGLLLDPEHVRQSQDQAIKAAIQLDAAECFL